MKLKDDIPVEPLSDAAWHRVEQAIFEELDGQGRARFAVPERTLRWPLVALAAVLTIQGAAALAFVIARSPSERAELESVRFVAGAEASYTQLGDVAIAIERASALTVVKDAGAGSLVVLERGAARFSVPKREQRPAFVVQAGAARIEVVGTRFRVERVGGSARVDAYEGTVRVVAGDTSVALHAGQHWPSRRPEPPHEKLEAPATQAPEPEPRVEPAAQNRRNRFERAAALEASDPQESLRIYGTLAAERGRWGANALYAMGRLELERGHRTSATRLLRDYVARHPQGANISDARALLARMKSEAKGAPL